MKKLIQDSFTAGTGIDLSVFSLGNKSWHPGTLTDRLGDLLSDSRKERIEEVLEQRTFNIATVVEGLVDVGNVSAVMRTAEGFGFQPFHIVNNGGEFKQSERVSHGAEKWLSTWQWAEPHSCTEFLKKQGYEIIVTTLDKQAASLTDIDFTKPKALVFGNETEGVTESMQAQADRTCFIPMTGFTQSLNISVAAAISLFYAYEDRISQQGFHGDLTDKQRAYLKALFYFQSVNKAAEVLKKMN